MSNNKFRADLVFLGEAYKFHPKPMPKTHTPEYTPYHIQTHDISIPKVPYPYVDMRFEHLYKFSIPHDNFVHPHLKDLKITESMPVEHEKFEIPLLGKTDETIKENKPNEMKLQMGFNEKSTVKDLAVSNLKESSGTETTLTRHKDEEKYEAISALPFEEQYLDFLNDKNKVKAIDKKIKAFSDKNLTTEQTDSYNNVMEKKKSKINLESRLKKKTVVLPVTATGVTTTTIPETTTTIPVTTANPVTTTNPQEAVAKKPRKKVTKSNLNDDGLDNLIEKAVAALSTPKQMRTKPMGESVGKIVNNIEMTESNLKLASDLNQLVSNIRGQTKLSKPAQELIEKMGIEVPANATTTFAKNLSKKLTKKIQL